MTDECAERLTYHAAPGGCDQDNVSGHLAVGKSLGYGIGPGLRHRGYSRGMKAGSLIKRPTCSDSGRHARKAAWLALFNQLD